MCDKNTLLLTTLLANSVSKTVFFFYLILRLYKPISIVQYVALFWNGFLNFWRNFEPNLFWQSIFWLGYFIGKGFARRKFSAFLQGWGELHATYFFLCIDYLCLDFLKIFSNENTLFLSSDNDIILLIIFLSFYFSRIVNLLFRSLFFYSALFCPIAL